MVLGSTFSKMSLTSMSVPSSMPFVALTMVTPAGIIGLALSSTARRPCVGMTETTMLASIRAVARSPVAVSVGGREKPGR